MLQLKPQDIVVAVKLLVLPYTNSKWSFHTLGKSLGMGHNQAHLAYKRLVMCDLVTNEFRRPIKKNLLEFCVSGIRYVFPPKWLGKQNGIPTSISGPRLKEKILSDENIVWPAKRYKQAMPGQGLAPLHASVVIAATSDPKCYEILSVIEALRSGRARERTMATDSIKELILGS